MKRLYAVLDTALWFLFYAIFILPFAITDYYWRRNND